MSLSTILAVLIFGVAIGLLLRRRPRTGYLEEMQEVDQRAFRERITADLEEKLDSGLRGGGDRND